MITREEIEQACSQSDDVWRFGNSILYRMCAEHPRHDDLSMVVGKVWLIGRTYAAAVERYRLPQESSRIPSDIFYTQHVGPALLNAGIDKVLDEVRRFRELSEESLTAVLKAHCTLVEALRPLTNQDKVSLASKYAHFHAPEQMPIYDSVAMAGLRRVMPRRRPTRSAAVSFNQTYTRFTLRWMDLRDELEQRFGVRLRPRELDRLLLRRGASS
jgi:hypothetical protein